MKKATAPAGHRAAAAGFTLIELIISTTIGAMLLVAVAEVAQLFGKEVEVVRDEGDWRLQEAVVRITDEAKRGWIVQEPSADVLALTDVFGNSTTYEHDATKKELKVTRSSGVEGVVLTDIESFNVETRTSMRLREATSLDSYGTWFEQTAISTPIETVTLEEGLSLAMGFTLSSKAPDWVHTVDGVKEQTSLATLERVLMPLSFVPPVAEPISTTESSSESTSKKVDVCHIPPGNPTGAKVLKVSSAAVAAHLAHGDVEGTCTTTAAPVPDPALSVLYIDLHEAATPDDARPYGPVLATISLPVTALPSGSWIWTTKESSTSTSEGEGLSGSSISVCHIPPANPANGHTLHVTSNALQSHLNHGDVLGSCDDAADSTTTNVLQYAAPTTPIPLDLAGLNAIIKPGRAHTLVFRLVGSGTVLLAGQPVGSASNSGIAGASTTGGSFSPLDYAVPRILDGMRSYSQTTESSVVTGITLNLTTTDGKQHAGSASIVSQSAVDNPWLGCIPGEFPGLELAGQ